MKVEHLTLGGNSVIRDTNTILPETRKVFSLIGWTYNSQVLHLPRLPFQVKITAAEKGAMFDIQKNGQPVVLNICCFDAEYTNSLFTQLDPLVDMYKKMGVKVKVTKPVAPQWLYSVIINPVGLSGHDMVTAGEVELYIYEQLYLAWLKTKKPL